MKKTKSLIVIVGPTAVGKTNAAVQLARYYRTEIISADARQFYREMTIGTAKPTPEEMQGVRHHFVDFLDISEEYNAGVFEKDAIAALSEIFVSRNIAIMCGGAGLYIKAVCEGMDKMPDIPPDIRVTLNEQYHTEGIEALIAELQSLDPEYYKIVDRKNPRRIIRALEVCLATGSTYSSFRNNQLQKRPFHIIKVGLTVEKETLYARIHERLDRMIAAGLFEEAEMLYPSRKLNALQTVGYQEIFDFFEGKYDKQEAIRLLKRNTRRYAKRQMTWFRKDPHTKWFHPDKLDAIIDFINLSLPR